jgi:signal transduction histidine kinase
VHHGHAQRITVELQYHSEFVWLGITDDGIGFDAHRSLPGHFGLLDMKERAQSMRSSLNIKSVPGRGTMIAVEAHFQANAEASKADSYSGG